MLNSKEVRPFFYLEPEETAFLALAFNRLWSLVEFREQKDTKKDDGV